MQDTTGFSIKNQEQVNIMNVKLSCDCFRFSLMDDTGMHEYPVLFMNIKDIKLAMRKYEDIDDAADFILKKMGILKRNIEEGKAFNDT